MGVRFRPGYSGCAHLQAADNAKALGVALKAACVAHGRGEDLLGDVTERRVAGVVGERRRLGGVGVELVDELDTRLLLLETLGQTTGDLGDLERVGEPIVKGGAWR